MKNKFFALGLIALSLATVSCSNDDEQVGKVSAVETAKVSFSVVNNESATGKTTIDRNAAPVTVDEVTIWANSAYGNVLQSFDFGTATGLPTGFFLNGVALGSNTFGATSNGADANQVLSISTNADWDLMKAKTPYVRCYSLNNAPVIIKKHDNAPVVLNMVTDYGRILAKFVQETPDASRYIATVQPTVMAWDDDLSYVAPKTLAETTITPTTCFEWSNSDALFIYKASFKLRVYEKLANGTKGALLNTIDKEVQIAKAKTKLCTFTIKNTDVETNIENGGIVLNFPTIVDEVVND